MTPSIEVMSSPHHHAFPDGPSMKFTSETQVLAEVMKPGPHDVLLGRGGGTNNHSGNIKFRKLVNEHKMRYLACSKVDKPKVAREVVQLWRKMSPPGRFLARKDETKRGPGSIKSEDNVWIEVGDKKAREKASQCLRERTPDVMPYLKHLREQQDALTEQGVSMVQKQLHMQQDPQSGPSQQNQQAPPQQQQYYEIQGAPSRSPASNQAYIGRRASMPMAPEMNGMMQQSHHPVGQYQVGFSQKQHAVQMMPQAVNTPFVANRSTVASSVIGQQEVYGSKPQEFYQPAPRVGDMTDTAHQHNMMLLQNQMHMQQVQMMRMQRQQEQERLQLQQQQHQQAVSAASLFQEPYAVRSDPLFAEGMESRSSLEDVAEHSTRQPAQGDMARSALKNSKRGREEPNDRNPPDRAPTSASLMSFNTNDDDDGGEITIEKYRQQLQEYMDNNQIGGESSNNNRADDDDCPSDLEDDWEKEREKNMRHQSGKRGVDRTQSGCSFMSHKTTKSGLSMVSGISSGMFSNDLSSEGGRGRSMSGNRSLCSNLSLMSELTDLSENIDKLGLDDD